MSHQLDRILSQKQIEERIVALGRQISQDYVGKEPVLACVLRGSAYFAVDLSRQLTVPHTLDFIAISSYSQSGNPLGEVRISKDLDTSIVGRDVLIIEDIVDTG